MKKYIYHNLSTGIRIAKQHITVTRTKLYYPL